MTSCWNLVLLFALLGSCTPTASLTHFRGAAMGTSYSIKVVLPQGVAREQAKARIDETLREFDLLFSLIISVFFALFPFENRECVFWHT